MPRTKHRNDDVPDDGTSAGGDDNTYNTYDSRGGGGGGDRDGRGISILRTLFSSCEEDPLGSVHRAWGVTVLLMTLFFAVSIVEATKLHEASTGASFALEVASIWSAILHLLLSILGTFVLKRFSTAFTIGCFLGLTIVISQQNLLLFAAFYHYGHGDRVFNVIFADLAFALFVALTFFSLILGHFRNYVIVK